MICFQISIIWKVEISLVSSFLFAVLSTMVDACDEKEKTWIIVDLFINYEIDKYNHSCF